MSVPASGTITASGGAVDLIGARTASVSSYGDRLQAVTATGRVTQVPVGPNGKPSTALVTLSGHVTAPVGSVLLQGDAANGIVQDVVVVGGLTVAHRGMITVGAIGGDALVSGRLGTQGGAGATGGDIGGNGGTVEVSGQTLGFTGSVDVAAPKGTIGTLVLDPKFFLTPRPGAPWRVGGEEHAGGLVGLRRRRFG